MMTRKDYVKVADMLSGYSDNPDFFNLVYDFVDFFESDNPNFDRFRFLNACGLDVVGVNTK